MKTPKISIRWKLMISLIGFSIILVLIMLYGISNSVENRIKENIDSSFTEAGRIFDRIQEVRFRQIRQTAILLADLPSLKAAISTGDENTISLHIREDLYYLLDFDPLIPDELIPEVYFTDVDSAGLLMITDTEGWPMGQLATSELPDYSLTGRPGVRDALRGNYPQNTYIWKQDDRYFSVITVPVFLRDRLMGSLTYGLPIRKAETEYLARDLGNEVSYFVDNKILSTSFTDLTPENLESLTRDVHSASYEVLQTGEAVIFDHIKNDEIWQIYVSPMQQVSDDLYGLRGYYVVAQSLTKELAELRNLQFIIFTIGLLAVIAAIIFGILFTRHITKPINLLISGIQRIEQGNYSEKVPEISQDEIGLLTRTFNNLVDNLRERLMMLKFVSDATQEAIKTNMSEIKLGGERKNVTVLFSDIRGFTKWSEKRSPEQVIEMLNTFLRVQAEIVKQHDGDIDKFVGDELVAVFQGKGMEQNAVNAAIEMQRKTSEITKDRDG